jgi:hypothetical protein
VLQGKILTEDLMILKRVIFAAFALLLGVCWNSARVEAQTMTTGSVRGTVTNPKNAVVANAEVLLTNNAKGTIQTVKTSLSGTYQFGLLDPGSYTLTVTYTGFQQLTKIVTVPLGEAVVVDFQLSLQPQGPVRAQAASLLHKENGSVGTTLSRLQVAQIPNPGNDLTYLAQLSPGTVMNTTGAETGNFSNYGMAAISNRFSVDGMEENAPLTTVNYTGSAKNLLGTNEVQDVSIVSNAYTGSSGQFAGAGVDYVTSSGTNNLHGSATYFWNQRLFNANNFFNNTDGTPRPFDGENQWQGSVGGPLKKDKVFFYIDSEGLRVLVPQSSFNVVPSPYFESHDDTYLTQNGLTDVEEFYQNSIYTLVQEAPDYVYALDNQPTGTTIPPFLGATQEQTGSGCGNFNLDPAFYGSGALPCSLGFFSSPTALTTEYMVDSRIDINVSAKDRLFWRYEHGWGKQATYIDPISTSFNIASNQPENLGELEWTHDFGTTAANQVLVGSQWYSAILQHPAQSLTGVNFPTTISIVGEPFFTTAGPNPCANPPIGDGIAVFIGGENCAVPRGYATTNIQVSDDFSKVIGGNTIRFGGDFRRVDVSDHDFGTLQSGLLTVEGTEIAGTLNGLNNFFSGGNEGDTLTQSFPQSQDEPIAYFTAGGYVEDDWRFSKTLSLTFAFRLEHDSDPICRHLCFADLSAPFESIVNGENQSELQQIPYSQAINTNQLHALPSLQSILYQPRVSFAWQPFGASSKTVFRGGVGLFYNMFPPQVVDSFAQNPPLDPSFTVTNDYIVPNATAAGAPNIFNDVTLVDQAFQSGFYADPGETSLEIAAVDPSFENPVTTGTVLSLFTTETKTKVPEYQKWSLEMQQQLGSATLVTLSYVGNHGIHEPIIDNSVNSFGIADLSSAALPPDLRFGEVSALYSRGDSRYNGGTLAVTHRISGGWGTGVIQGSYTFSRALDEVSNDGFTAFSPTSLMNPEDPTNTQGNYGPADYDVRHSGNVNGVWELPFRRLAGGRGPAALLDGWQLSGVFFARTGFPYSVVDSSAFGGDLGPKNNYYSQVMPLFFGGPKGCEVTPNGPGCLEAPGTAISSSCATSLPGALTAAACEFNVGEENTFAAGERNMFRGPSFVNFDAALMKSTRLSFWEGARFAVGVQVYNVLNHPNFGLPVNDASSSEFGEILNTVSSPTSIYGSFLGGDGSPRLIQFKAQFSF